MRATAGVRMKRPAHPGGFELFLYVQDLMRRRARNG